MRNVIQVIGVALATLGVLIVAGKLIWLLSHYIARLPENKHPSMGVIGLLIFFIGIIVFFMSCITIKRK